jgi:hypothetical protein
MLEDFFRPRPAPRWTPIQTGGGNLLVTGDGLRMLVAGAQRHRYADAQLEDYTGLRRSAFPWRPPLRLTVRARASERLVGTAGFGFWNNCFSPLVERPALPAAIWFFYASPPSDMPLALGVPGQGWKAATIDARGPRALAWAPLAPLVLLANQLPALERKVWPRVQRDLRIAEAPLDLPGQVWRSFAIEWRADSARFGIDGRTVLETDRSPAGPLGFVAWVDNQYAIVTPRGRFGWGLLDVDQQWLDLACVQVEGLS